MSNLACLSAVELLAGYRRKAFSPVEVARACLARIDDQGAKLNAFVHVDADGAMAAAGASEARWQRDAPAGAVKKARNFSCT